MMRKHRGLAEAGGGRAAPGFARARMRSRLQRAGAVAKFLPRLRRATRAAVSRRHLHRAASCRHICHRHTRSGMIMIKKIRVRPTHLQRIEA